MPYTPHLRITALGRINNTVERFSYGLQMAVRNDVQGVPDLTDVLQLVGAQPNTTVLDDIAEDLRAFHGRTTTNIHPAAVLEEVKIARIGADGLYTDEPYVANVANTPGGGTARNTILPQSALAVSLMTDKRGPRGRGRFFIPMPSVTLEDRLVVEGSEITSIEGSVVTLINALGNQPGLDQLDLRVVVASSFGTNSEVTAIRMGRVVDTIRSRRRSIPEEYTGLGDVNQV